MSAWLAKSVYYPTLAYNFLLGRVLKVRNWFDLVHEQVYLGARPLAGDPERFDALGITGVVNTCEEMRGPIADYERLGIEQLWVPTTDFHHPTAKNVEAAADFVQRHVALGGKVYVHCKAGRARSATVVLWWLVRFQGLTPEQAQEQILKARPHANPRVYQRPVIVGLYKDLQERQSAST